MPLLVVAMVDICEVVRKYDVARLLIIDVNFCSNPWKEFFVWFGTERGFRIPLSHEFWLANHDDSQVENLRLHSCAPLFVVNVLLGT